MNDGMNAVRGILVALALSVVIWAGIILIAKEIL